MAAECGPGPCRVVRPLSCLGLLIRSIERTVKKDMCILIQWCEVVSRHRRHPPRAVLRPWLVSIGWDVVIVRLRYTWIHWIMHSPPNRQQMEEVFTILWGIMDWKQTAYSYDSASLSRVMDVTINKLDVRYLLYALLCGGQSLNCTTITLSGVDLSG